MQQLVVFIILFFYANTLFISKNDFQLNSKYSIRQISSYLTCDPSNINCINNLSQIYKNYCTKFNNIKRSSNNTSLNCSIPGQFEEQEENCCSQIWYNKRCLGNKYYPAQNGDFCLNDYECKSDNCFRNTCIGNHSGSNNLCDPCNDGLNCRSGSCRENFCIGSKSQPAPFNFPCTDDFECLSQSCIQNKCR